MASPLEEPASPAAGKLHRLRAPLAAIPGPAHRLAGRSPFPSPHPAVGEPAFGRHAGTCAAEEARLAAQDPQVMDRPFQPQ